MGDRWGPDGAGSRPPFTFFCRKEVCHGLVHNNNGQLLVAEHVPPLLIGVNDGVVPGPELDFHSDRFAQHLSCISVCQQPNEQLRELPQQGHVLLPPGALFGSAEVASGSLLTLPDA